MKIALDPELDAWRYYFPSGIVSWRITGDSSYADKFRGEGKNLLHRVIIAMKFNKLPTFQMERRFPDGTIVRAKSVYGNNTIEIDVSKSTVTFAGIKGTCTITFINFPLSVPPMENPAIIEPTDVVGIDYFKTYYSFDVSKCSTCQDIAWDFLFTYATPVEPRHYDDEPSNHTVYSLSPPAWAQVIDHGQDDGGNYIIWKAYTETGELSRTGLGIMLLKAVISDNSQNIICNQQQKIDVDCCLKTPDLRKVEIWWEDFGTCQPYINYGGIALCKMPITVPIGGASGLLVYRSGVGGHPLYGIPDINGSCLPLEWTLSGALSLSSGSDKNDNEIYFDVIETECHSSGQILLADRCGTTYEVLGTPCCDDAAPLSISYTSLLMSCGGQQTLMAVGGCGPYSWAVTAGGGTISFNPNDSVEAVYTAPATNVNCVDNPTITVTDCCGGSASISLAVNCYTGPELSLGYARADDCQGCFCDPRGCDQGQIYCRDYIVDTWKCDGTVISHCETKPCSVKCPTFDNWNKIDCTPTTACWTNQCGCPWLPGQGGGCLCDTLYDSRTSNMKNQGCCPLNPLTGLPY